MNQLLQFATQNPPEVSLPAETIFSLGGIPISNSVILGTAGFLIVLAILAYTAYAVKRGKRRTFLVQLVDLMYEALYKTVRDVVGDEKLARTLAPLPITMFFFIIIQYYLGLLPVVGSVTYHGHPLFRAYVSDLNTTFGLAIVTLITAEIYALKVHSFFGSVGRYLRNPIKDPAGSFEGILEIIAQFSRTVALSMRLFGNVFAGEVLLIMIAFLAQYLASVALPLFYLFELFIGAIQAYIFFMLTTIFIALGLSAHGPSAPVKASEPAGRPHESAHSSADNATAASG